MTFISRIQNYRWIKAGLLKGLWNYCHLVSNL